MGVSNHTGEAVRRVQAGEKKTFEEQIWLMGKVLGTVRGVFTLSNMPVMQQMALGVLTEAGISMNVSPVADNALLIQRKGKLQNEKITLLIENANKLKKIDTASTNKNNRKMDLSKYNEKLQVLNSIIDLLIDDDKTLDGHMFKYHDELDLLRA